MLDSTSFAKKSFYIFHLHRASLLLRPTRWSTICEKLYVAKVFIVWWRILIENWKNAWKWGFVFLSLCSYPAKAFSQRHLSHHLVNLEQVLGSWREISRLPSQRQHGWTESCQKGSWGRSLQGIVQQISQKFIVRKRPLLTFNDLMI